LSIARRDIAVCQAAWSQSTNWSQVQQLWHTLDTQHLLGGLLQDHVSLAKQGMASWTSRDDQLNSSLRQALQGIRLRLRYGQDLLATIGATSPFIGLLGTVWGIYHALVSLAQAGQYTLDKVAQPVGESLVMTAAGLGVAIPAVMAYNLLGKRLSAIEAVLDGMAFDLRAYFLSRPPHDA